MIHRTAQLIVGIVVVCVAALIALPHIERLQYPLRFTDEIKAASDAHNVPRNLIAAVIREESRFNPDSTSHASAQGLMQLLPETSRWIAEKQGLPYDANTIKDPRQNINFGTWYLSYLQKQLKNDTLALEAYNAGITNVIEWEKKQPGFIAFPETDNFVKRVNASRSAYNRIYGENWERLNDPKAK